MNKILFLKKNHTNNSKSLHFSYSKPTYHIFLHPLQNARPVKLLPTQLLPKGFHSRVMSMPLTLPPCDFGSDVEHAADSLAGEEVAAGPAVRVFDDMAHAAVEIEPYL